MLNAAYRRIVGRAFVASLAACCALALWQPSRESSAFPSVTSNDSSPHEGLKYVGAASCSSTACHNTGGARAGKGSEYSVWMGRDAHAKAYSVLTDESSMIIERNFRNLKDLKDARPEKDHLCLSCHTMTAEEKRQGGQFSVEDGVSCESCHGPAERWRTQHYLAEWKEKTQSEKNGLGMLPTKDILARARACASCHVGTPDSNVNHDLIASGHPRLNFEFGAYLTKMPKHWNLEDDKARYPDLEARAWAVGQAVSAQWALDVLQSRADDAKQPWPELSDFNCYSCHHELREPSWRQKRAQANQLPGAPAWSSWYLIMPRLLAQQGPFADAETLTSVNELQKLVNKENPERKQVADLARAASAHLKECQEKWAKENLDHASLSKLLHFLARDSQKAADASWDGAAQLYLGLAALDQALADMDADHRASSLKPVLKKMINDLDFPPNLSSPRDYRPDKFAKHLQEIQRVLGK